MLVGERQKLYHRKIDPSLIEKLRKKRLNEKEMYAIILELLVYVIFISVLLSLTYSNRSVTVYPFPVIPCASSSSNCSPPFLLPLMPPLGLELFFPVPVATYASPRPGAVLSLMPPLGLELFFPVPVATYASSWLGAVFPRSCCHLCLPSAWICSSPFLLPLMPPLLGAVLPRSCCHLCLLLAWSCFSPFLLPLMPPLGLDLFFPVPVATYASSRLGAVLPRSSCHLCLLSAWSCSSPFLLPLMPPLGFELFSHVPVAPYASSRFGAVLPRPCCYQSPPLCRDPNAFLLRENLRHSLIHEGRLDNKDFTQSYNGASPYQLKGFMNDQVNRIMGYATIRQIRAKKFTCSVPPEMRSITLECSANSGLVNEESTSYCAHWLLPTNDTRDTDDCQADEFRYATATELRSLPIWGKRDWYGGGGYVIRLRAKTDVLLERLTYLQQTHWIDRMTRATNLFGVATLIADFIPGGGIFPTYRVDGVRLLQHQGDFNLFTYLMEASFVLFVAYFTVMELRLLVRLKKKYFENYWSYVEIGLIVAGYSAIVLYVLRYASPEVLVRPVLVRPEVHVTRGTGVVVCPQVHVTKGTGPTKVHVTKGTGSTKVHVTRVLVLLKYTSPGVLVRPQVHVTRGTGTSSGTRHQGYWYDLRYTSPGVLVRPQVHVTRGTGTFSGTRHQGYWYVLRYTSLEVLVRLQVHVTRGTGTSSGTRHQEYWYVLRYTSPGVLVRPQVQLEV
ncbi:hypothetical protein HAZT_HAZT003931 [Hyalella azteca]|uniref:Uncharacterized protein n=1 Tax=Hyalella azteca TaxID=294128 RepID=A0A6A0GR26_HYAAZ|nr:hypothetical protein HAZT_HAZT003931 [Hyalella azteca]